MPTELAPASKTIEFETDLVVYGMMAAHWADTGGMYGCCKRGWGNDLRSGGIQVGNDFYTAGHVMSDKNAKALAAFGPGRLGLLVTKHFDNRNGGKRQISKWIPMEAFKKAKLILEGCDA